MSEAAAGDASLTIKTSTGTKYSVTCSLDATVSHLKELIGTVASVPVEDQKLIFSGRILKDDKALVDYGIKAGTSIHLVKAKKVAASKPAATTATGTAATSRDPPTARPNPTASFGAMGAMGQGMPSQEEMSRMMDNPMVQSMLNSPEVMEAMLMSNPQMREIVEQNPELGRAMRDPAILRQAMEMQRNPAMMRESMRAQDRAMSNVESMPGGFNHLRQMYSNVQEPLERAADSMRQQQAAPSQTSAERASSGAAANPFAALFGASANAGGNTDTDTASGAAGGNGAGAAGAQASLFSNPVVVESMRQAMSNPEVLDQIASLNPYMNTEALRNPANLEAMMKMQQAMQRLDSAGITSELSGLAGASGGVGAADMQSMMSGVMGNPATVQAMMQPENVQAMMELHQSMTTLQQAGLMPTPEGMGASPQMGGTSGAQQSTPGYRERYTTEIAEVRAMGFTDEAAIIQALVVCEGNVQNAINFLLG